MGLLLLTQWQKLWKKREEYSAWAHMKQEELNKPKPSAAARRRPLAKSSRKASTAEAPPKEQPNVLHSDNKTES